MTTAKIIDSLENAHVDLQLIQKFFYEPQGMQIEHLRIENESADYGAAEFILRNQRVKFRVGKITPTKSGQFVTFWKRIGNGPIMPYDFDDSFDLFIVSVRVDNRLGLFTFPKNVLYEKGVISKNLCGGKRALRIYPPWDKTESIQAKKTQAWQLPYFVDVNFKKPFKDE